MGHIAGHWGNLPERSEPELMTYEARWNALRARVESYLESYESQVKKSLRKDDFSYALVYNERALLCKRVLADIDDLATRKYRNSMIRIDDDTI